MKGLSIEGKPLYDNHYGEKVTFIPIDNTGDPKFTWLEGTIVSFNDYYVFVDVSGELKTFFANNLRWGHLKKNII